MKGIAKAKSFYHNPEPFCGQGVAGLTVEPISVTGPAFVTLHTGQLPSTHGVVMNLFRGGPSLSPATPRLAKRLAHREYATGAFVSGFTLRKEMGLRPGFRTYQGVPLGTRRVPGKENIDRTLSWLERQEPDRDIFVWYHSYDPHGPLNVWSEEPGPGKWRDLPEERARYPEYQRVEHVTDPVWFAQQYALAVEAVDEQVGSLLAFLDRTDRYKDALIIFTADHGETFDERDQWFGHGNYASAEQLHVPLIIKFPDNDHAGDTMDRLVGLEDIAPTVLDVMNLQPFGRADGRSLLDHPGYDVVLGESSHCKDDPLLRCRPRGVKGKEFSARSTTTTLIERPVDGDQLEREVYQRTRDPAERSPLKDGTSPLLSEAITPLRKHRLSLNLDVPSTSDDAAASPAEKAEREALKALGYIE